MSRKLILVLLLLITACNSNTPQPQSTEIKPPQTSSPATIIVPHSTATPDEPVHASTPQPFPTPVTYGPDEFPQDYNPLSGERVADRTLLDIPALLISISHFPPAARPQAGLSFAPFVFEYFITEGATRYLAVFHGEAPEPEIPLRGDCEARAEPLPRADQVLGNRVWHDQDRNGKQDPGEGGIGGICVSLLDANGRQSGQTTTDSNGYYGFNVEEGEYSIRFEKPSWLEFTQQNVGEEGMDSDADPDLGQIGPVHINSSSLLFWDAGFVFSPGGAPTPDPAVEWGTMMVAGLLV